MAFRLVQREVAGEHYLAVSDVVDDTGKIVGLVSHLAAASPSNRRYRAAALHPGLPPWRSYGHHTAAEALAALERHLTGG